MKKMALIAAAAALLSGCGNSANGPPRLFIAGAPAESPVGATCVDGQVQVPATTEPSDRHLLSDDFFARACASFEQEEDESRARLMTRLGVTLTTIRCRDFFHERGGNQTRERILRGSIAPVSALLTGLVGAVDFDSDADRLNWLEVLALGESASLATLDLYEREFLFGAENVASVEVLVLRALEVHGQAIEAQNVDFHQAARNLVQHERICTPAAILDLTRSAIRNGQVAARTTSGAVEADVVSPPTQPLQ